MANRQRSIAPPAAFGWRYLFPACLVLLGVGTYVLAKEGARQVLNDNTSETAFAELEPTAPGYEAFVKPTETLFVTVHDDADELVGVALLALATGGGGGGTILVVPADLVDSDRGDELHLLGQTYADGGVDAVASTLASMLNIGFSGVVDLGEDQFETLLVPYLPLNYDLDFTLEAVSQDGRVTTLLGEADGLELDADTAFLVFSHRNNDEEGINRAARQRALFTSLLDAVRGAGSVEEVVENADVAMLRRGLDHLARADEFGVVIDRLAVSSTQLAFENGSGLTVLYPDEPGITEQILDAVPLPQPPSPGARPAVKLTNGHGDISQNPAIIREIVGAGGVLTVLANADIADVVTSELHYRSDAQLDEANEMAAALGIEEVVFTPELEELIDFDIIVGADLVG